MKWCSGLCGRELPLSAFHRGHGACKGCHRVRARESFRKRYLRASFRKRWGRKVKAWRTGHRDQLNAARRDLYWRRKLAA